MAGTGGQGLHLALGPLNVVGYQVLFLVSGLLRISSLLLARGIKEKP